MTIMGVAAQLLFSAVTKGSSASILTPLSTRSAFFDHQHYCTNQHYQLAHSTHMCILNYHENTNLTDTIAVSATSMLHIRYLVKLVLQNSKLASSCTSSLT